ncbi:hypothetical protein LSH36_144g02058 [Paralvinella palmiformis]|uniref:Uncharacterized protein n=1 Tax=Paralvinella palmiformis TaxID=53620 RepID=A0AAD9JX98_9ANNE|nr:hypothetical protein LSH36_144g02058 [Paralvinella palmiformis]
MIPNVNDLALLPFAAPEVDDFRRKCGEDNSLFVDSPPEGDARTPDVTCAVKQPYAGRTTNYNPGSLTSLEREVLVSQETQV